jgi:hypothetical protein
MLSGYQLDWGTVPVGQTSNPGQVQLTDIGDGKASSGFWTIRATGSASAISNTSLRVIGNW